MNHLFSMEGPLMRALSDLTILVILNLCTLLCSIPIVTAGAAFTALHYCIMKMVDGNGNLAKEYFKQFKLNLKESTPVSFLFILGISFFYINVSLFGQKEGGFVPVLVPVYAIALVLAIMFVWVFPLMARITNSFFARCKNALILAVSHLPRTLAMVLIYAIAVFVFSQDMRLLPIAFLLGISLPTYFCVLTYYPVIKDVIDRMSHKSKQDADKESDNETYRGETTEESEDESLNETEETAEETADIE